VGGTGNTSSLAMTCFASLVLSHPPEVAFSIGSHSLLDSLASQTHEDLHDYLFIVTLILTIINLKMSIPYMKGLRYWHLINQYFTYILKISFIICM